MRTKTYQTTSIQEALDDIKRDLGAEALILGTRAVSTRKRFGLRRRKQWEVTAAVRDEVRQDDPSSATADLATAAMIDTDSVRDTVQLGSQAGREEAATAAPGGSAQAVPAVAAPISSTSEDERIHELLDDMEELKRSVRQLGSALPQNDVPGGRNVYSALVGQGIDPDTADELVRKASSASRSAADKGRGGVRSLLADLMNIDSPVELESAEPVISVFVGPTGVGKTTTIAKIAGQAAARHGKRVALISTDSLRVGGQEQLARYGELLGIPAYACSDASALGTLIETLNDRDLILIDTPGCSPADLARLSKLRRVINGLGARVHLVLSATTKSEDLAKTIKRFHRYSPGRLVFTKIDETESKGNLVGELLRHGLPLSFLTDGQSVPEDLVIPDAHELSCYVLPARRSRRRQH